MNGERESNITSLDILIVLSVIEPEMETGGVDRPVKPVETPVKFSLLATKRDLSTNRNIHIYFITNKIFYKKQY